MKIVLGMVLVEGSKKEVEELLKHPEIRELLQLQRDLMDDKKSQTGPAPGWMTFTGNSQGNV